MVNELSYEPIFERTPLDDGAGVYVGPIFCPVNRQEAGPKADCGDSEASRPSMAALAILEIAALNMVI